MKNLRNKIKNTKGITLIALIITILVILILAGVVINMTIGNNGIISKSQSAAEIHEKAALTERIDSIKLGIEMDAISEYRNPTVEEFLAELEKTGMLANSEKTGEDEYTVITREGYVITIGLDESKKHLAVNIGDKDPEILTRQVEIQTITGEAIGSLDGKVTITTNGAIGVTYTYEAIVNGTTVKTETSTKKSIRFTGLSPSTTYDVKVTATGKGTDTKTQTSAFTTASIPAGDGHITGTILWNSETHKAQIKVNTEITDFGMKYGTTSGTYTTTIANNETTTEEYNVGDKIYVIFTSGENEGSSPAEITVTDGEPPVITNVTLTTTGEQNAGATIKGTYVATDNESGIDLNKSKWLLDPSPTEKDSPSSFNVTGLSGSLYGHIDTNGLNLGAVNTQGVDYHLHLMIVDNGNPAKVAYAVSTNTVTIKKPPVTGATIATNFSSYAGHYVTGLGTGTEQFYISGTGLDGNNNVCIIIRNVKKYSPISYNNTSAWGIEMTNVQHSIEKANCLSYQDALRNGYNENSWGSAGVYYKLQTFSPVPWSLSNSHAFMSNTDDSDRVIIILQEGRFGMSKNATDSRV